MCFLPLYTATVCPMKSGNMTDARDQVLTTFFSLRLFIVWTRPRSRDSTNGPFLTERDMPLSSALRLAVTRADDESARRLLAKTRAIAHGRLAPPRLRRHARRGLAFAAAVRMVSRVHYHAADFGPLAHMPCASRLAQVLILVIEIGDLADGGHATEADSTNLARRKPDGRVVTLFGEQLGRHARGADDLATLARHELDVVDRGTERDVHQRQRVTHPSLGFETGNDHVADLQTVRQEHVALLAVLVVQKADSGRPVGVVLDGGQLGRDVELVPLEVDDAVVLLLAAAAMANGDPALIVPAGTALLRLHERLVGFSCGDLLEGRPGHAPEAGGGCLVTTQRHLRLPRRTRSSGRGPASRLPCARGSSGRRLGSGASHRASLWSG